MKYNTLNICIKLKEKNTNDGLQTIVYSGKHLYILGFSGYFVALIADLFQKKVFRSLAKKVELTENNWDDVIMHSITLPISVIIWATGIAFAVDPEKTFHKNGQSHAEQDSLRNPTCETPAFRHFVLKLSECIFSALKFTGIDGNQRATLPCQTTSLQNVITGFINSRNSLLTCLVLWEIPVGTILSNRPT